MIINCDDKNWSETEREQLLTRATEIYMSKRRKTDTSSNEPAAKKIADGNLKQKLRKQQKAVVHPLVKTVIRYNSNAAFVNINYIYWPRFTSHSPEVFVRKKVHFISKQPFYWYLNLF